MMTAFVIVAAGRGERFGPRPKVLELAGGFPVVWWSIDAAQRASTIGEIVVVTSEQTHDMIESLRGIDWATPLRLVTGGTRRQDSVMAGVAALTSDCDVVLIHDGARPLVTPELIDACAVAAFEHGAVIAAAPVTDTLKRVEAGEIVDTVSRDGMWGAQTPQGFRRETLETVVRSLDFGSREFTDEASMCETAGIAVRIVPVTHPNPKVTHPGDLDLIEALLASRLAEQDRQTLPSPGPPL